MEDIARDPDIGPEFIALLTQKVKSTREALNISLKDNADLRKEITEIKEQVQELSSKSGVANVTCQFGQCTSKDTVESLRLQLAETAEKLKATQEALAESLNEVARLKGNYERAEGRAHERQEAVRGLQEGPREFQDMQEQTNPLRPELPVSTEDITELGADIVSETLTGQSFTPPIDERTSQPCMPTRMAPCQVPKDLQGLMCKGGSLFWPERSLVDHIHGSAITFACQKRYDRSVPNEAQRWIPSIELLGLKGKRREVFHRQDGEIMYAGTFQASTVVSEYGLEEYRALPEDLRKQLLTSSFAPAPPGHPRISEEEKAFVAEKYWSGEATLAYLRWDRVTFNSELFNALVSLRETCASLCSESGPHEVSASGSKRKISGHGSSSRKKSKFDQSVAMSLWLSEFL